MRGDYLASRQAGAHLTPRTLTLTEREIIQSERNQVSAFDLVRLTIKKKARDRVGQKQGEKYMADKQTKPAVSCLDALNCATHSQRG